MKNNPRFILIYSPQVFDPKFGAIKPEGSLGLIYLASALRNENYDVTLLDTTVGNDNYSLSDTFYKEEVQPNGMIRIGMKLDDIVQQVANYDAIGINSQYIENAEQKWLDQNTTDEKSAIRNLYLRYLKFEFHPKG